MRTSAWRAIGAGASVPRAHLHELVSRMRLAEAGVSDRHYQRASFPHSRADQRHFTAGVVMKDTRGEALRYIQLTN
jgi:hypothetical protein